MAFLTSGLFKRLKHGLEKAIPQPVIKEKPADKVSNADLGAAMIMATNIELPWRYGASSFMPPISA